MKIECPEHVSQGATISFIALSLVSLIMYGCYQCEETNRSAHKAGLEQVQMEGSQAVRWAKTK